MTSPNEQLFLIAIWGGVESSLEGPFPTEDERIQAARDYLSENGEESGVFRLDLTDGIPSVRDFINTEIDDDEEDELCVQLVEHLEALGFDGSSPSDSGGARVGCTQCKPSVINGVPCHESGCPNEKHECKGCNAIVGRGVTYCEDCQ